MGVSTLVLKCQSQDVLINFEYMFYKKKISSIVNTSSFNVSFFFTTHL